MKAVNINDVLKILHKYGTFIFVTDRKKYSDMENEIANLPSVTQNQQFINKPCISSGVCEHDKQKVLDEIKAEIEEHAKINYGLNTDRAKALCWCLNVIDKYKEGDEDG